MMGRMANAEKLSIPQLQQAIKNGTIPAYVGVPLLQDKVRQRQQAMAMQQAQQGQQAQDQVPLAAQVMQDADQYRGIDELPTNLPTAEDDQTVDDEYANGGIIAFADEGQVRDPARRSLSQDSIVTQLNERMGFQPYAGRTIYGRPEDAPKEITTQDILKSIDAQNPADYEYTAAQGAKNFTELAEQDKIANRRAADAELERIIAEKNRESARVAGAGIPQEPTLRVPVAGGDVGGFQAADRGIAALPAGQRGDGTTATPASGAGQRGVAPTDGSGTVIPTGNKGTGAGGALPPTLSAAEKSDSPIASQAVSMLDRYVEMLEKSGKDVSRDKKEALYMALIKGGLAAAGGTSPNALANIAAGVVPAMEGYSKEIAGIRKDERARLEKLVAAGVSKEKILNEAKKLGITEKHFDQMYSAEMAKLGVMGGQRADARAQAEDLKRLSVAQGLFKTLRSDQMMSGKSDDELWNQAQIMSGQIEAPAAPKSNIMGSYVPGKGYVPAGK
jgi:hypothetical protein